MPKIKCYPGQLNQVFMNLLANAAEAIAQNGEIRINTYIRDRKVCVSIKDTGEGIKPENIEKIFSPGFTTKGVGVGTGLGLAIVYNIIEKHNAKISVNSKYGKGSEFIIELPIE